MSVLGRRGAVQPGRVGRLVDFLELGETDLGVDLCGSQLLMAEHGLDEPDVGAVLQHVGGAGVAEQVTGAGLGDAGRVQVAFDQIAKPARFVRPLRQR